jgi:predicted transcriptional regulator
MQSSKVLTLRISPEEAQRAGVITRTEETSVSEVIRQALLHFFELERADADFVERAQAMLARDAEIVGSL